MTASLSFDQIRLPPECEELRADVRAFIADEGAWLINGTKIWTSNAHIADYMLGLFRTSPSTKENRRHGLTQFLVDMKTPGISVNPVYQLTGRQGAGGRGLDRQGHGHGLGTEAARPGARTCGFHRRGRTQSRHAGRTASLRDADRPQGHDPGRHDRSAARHHRARAG